MTSIERTAYPRLKSRYSPKELDPIFTPTLHELAFVKETSPNNDHPQLGLLAQLKCFQYLGYFPNPQSIPVVIVAHLQAAAFPDQAVTYQWKRTLYRHRRAIRRYLGVMAYPNGGQAVASQAIYAAAQTMHDPADLINAAIEELVHQSIELPAFSTLEALTQQIRTEVNEGWYQQVMRRLTPAEQALLLALPTRRDEQTATDFTLLKAPPSKPVLAEMKRIKNRLQWLRQLLDTAHLLQGIPTTRIQCFAAEARALEASHLSDYALPRRLTLLACFLHQVTIETRDHLIEIFLKRMRQIHQHAQEDLDAIREQQRQQSETMVRLLGHIAAEAEQHDDPTLLGRQVAQQLQMQGGAERVRQICEALAVYHDDNILPLLPFHYETYRRTLFEMLALLEMRSTTQDESLIQALHFVQRYQDDKAMFLPAELNLAFTSQRWQTQIIHQAHGQVWYEHRQLELCVFSHVVAELCSGDLAVKGSAQYADMRDQMLGWEACLPLLKDYGKRLGLPTSAKDFVRHLKRWLAQTARAVDRSFPDNTQLYFNTAGTPVLKRVRARPIPKAVKSFQRELQKRMPERHLLDVLVLAQRLAEFTRHFGPPSGADPKLKAATFTHLMTLFAYGTNIGPEDLARHALGSISARALTATNYQHVTAAKLDAALVDLINAYTHFDLPTYWGTGGSAAADGTLIDLYENNLLSAKHVRYGSYGGVAYYHIADNYIALFSHFISVGVWEAVYIIDGLLRNDSDIQPETLHADTQGQSLPVFGLTFMLGIDLMPRIRNWKELILYRPSAHTHYRHIDALFTQSIDFELLETHWQDLMQVVLSIQAGHLLPSTVLRKLGHHSRKNKLYRAFRELGRLIRTIFLLRFISDEALQRQVTVATNKVETYHAFREWIAFGQDSRITTHDPIEMEKRIKYSDVLANALILQNVTDMTRVVHQLAQEGYPVDLSYLAFLSPYWTSHIRRFGDYTLRFDLPPEPVTFVLPPPPPAPATQHPP